MATESITLSEILAQPSAWRATLDLLNDGEPPSELRRLFRMNAEWLFVGCGSSYHLAQAAAATFVEIAGVRARAVPASEILLYPDLLLADSPNIIPVLISRSGHTSEVLKVGEYFLHELGIPTYAVTCDGNELRDLSTWVMKVPVQERSTVMTASFTSMLIGLQHLAAVLAGRTDFIHALQKLPHAATQVLQSNAGRVESFVQGHRFGSYVFLGQGPYFGIASESMLKVMESSSSNAHCFHTLEFRHGPKSIVSPETLSVFLLSEKGHAAEVDVLEEVKGLGGATMVVANCASDPRVRGAADFLVELAVPIPELARLALSVLWGQLLGVYTGIAKGMNPDHPRNLSRVVIIAA